MVETVRADVKGWSLESALSAPHGYGMTGGISSFVFPHYPLWEETPIARRGWEVRTVSPRAFVGWIRSTVWNPEAG